MLNVTENTVWKKTSKLIFEKYGKKIEFVFMQNLGEPQNRITSYSAGDDLIIPIGTKNQFLGYVSVHRGATLSSEQKIEIQDLVDFLVRPTIYNSHLKIIEENAAMDSSSYFKNKNSGLSDDLADDLENVIPLFRKNSSVNTQIKSDNSSSENLSDKKSKFISPVLHLKSHSISTRQKVAMRLHEISKNTLFLPLKDVEKTVDFASDFYHFSDTTFYIEDLRTASAKEIHLLNEFSKIQDEINIIILVGSDLNEEQVKDQSNLSLKSQGSMIHYVYDIDRVPIVRHAHRDILELLFLK